MFQLRVLGSLDLRRADGSEVRTVLSQPKRTALLVYLAVARPGEFHRRDSLLALFWPEKDREHARSALNQAVYMLRQSLGEQVIETRGREEVGIAGGALWCDGVAVREALEAGDREGALELYRGHLLEGFHLSGTPGFERWLDRERSHLRGEARRAAVELAEASDDPGEARGWLERALQVAPTDEGVVRSLMEMLDAAGDRAGALRAYEALAVRLERSLEVAPSPEIRELAGRIRDRERAHPDAGRGTEEGGRGDAAATAAVAGEGGEAAVSDPSEFADEASGPAGRRPLTVAGRGARGGRLFDGLRDPRSRGLAAGAAALLAAGIGIGVASSVLGSGAPTPGGASLPTEPPAVAVLPFENLGPEEEGEYLAEGVTEDIMTALVRMGGLPVISRTSVMKYRDRRPDVEEIARELGVTHLVEGTVRRSGDRVVIAAKVIDAGADRHLWARTFDRNAADLIDVQREVARAIARELPVEISPEAAERAGTVPTTDARAYEFFLRGRGYHGQHAADPGERLRHALRMYRVAVERDPGFAQAWAGIATSHLNLYQWSGGRAGERVERAREAAERALTADSDAPWGHLALARLHSWVSGDLDAALRHFEAAEAAGLAISEVLAGKAGVLRREGRWEEAADLYERARALDPLNEDLIFTSWSVYLALRRYDEAEEALERTLELAPDHGAARRYLSRLPLLRDGDAEAVGPPASREWETLWRLGKLEEALAVRGPPELPGNEGRTRARRGLVLLEMGDTAAARAAFDSARVVLEDVAPRVSIPSPLRWLGIAYAGLGRREEALRVVRKARELHGEYFYVALIQILLGDEEEAIATLEKYLANPGARSLRSVATHPLVKPLRDHPRFRKLERRYGR